MASPSRSGRRSDNELESSPSQGSVVKRTPARRRAPKLASVSASPSNALDVIVAGWTAASLAEYGPALHILEGAGLIRVSNFVEYPGADREDFESLFPAARTCSSLDHVVLPPGALVLLASPVRLHPLHASAAFKRGWHVLCATPVANSTRDLSQMAAAAERHERVLAVDLRRRFHPSAHYLRSLCRDQLLGPLLSFAIEEGAPLAVTAPTAAKAKCESPDGVLADLGLPIFDFLIWSLGLASVLRYADDAMGGVEANALVELSFPEGVRGTVHLSRDWPTSQSCLLRFERGIVRWSVEHANRLLVQLGSAPAAIEGVLMQPWTAQSRSPSETLPSTIDSSVAQLKNIIAAIRGHETLRATVTDALVALPVIEECYARRTLLEQPWLSHNEAARARSLSAPTEFRRL